MRTAALLLASLVAVASARLSCKVKPLGGGQDDGPNILAAFKRCAKKGRVTLDKYYVVDTLLMTTGLDDIEIELSGVGKACSSGAIQLVLTCFAVQYTPDIAKWSPQSYYLTYQNA